MITITQKDKSVLVSAPFHPEFPAEARKLGGDYLGNSWTFDSRDLQAVLTALKTYFGYTPEGKNDLVDVRITIAEDDYLRASCNGVYLAGRLIAKASGRDSGAVLGNGIIMNKGEFTSGGSAKNWLTKSTDGAVFEIRDVYRLAASNIKEMFGWRDDIEMEVAIIEHAPAPVDESLIKQNAENQKVKEARLQSAGVLKDQVAFINQQIDLLAKQKSYLLKQISELEND